MENLDNATDLLLEIANLSSPYTSSPQRVGAFFAQALLCLVAEKMEENWSKRLRYKLASNLVLSTEKEQCSKIIENASTEKEQQSKEIIENAKKIPPHDYF
ncbi:uncharacterized protein LOC115992979 [Quercus lobata]|uniref:uncharacterized protein LOC115992979 n=1 Tax=Quercus lobata TaxID=97700 RepID=UPI001246A090|nr:uncharacterized protein LOC115992979 [Quercus lobata]